MMSSTYVGRHGNSVVGVRTTVALLLVIWIAFLVTWLLPVATRLMMKGPHTQMLESFSCPNTCGNARTVAQSWSTTQDDVTKRIFENKIQMNQSESATLDGWSNSANANMTSHPATVRRIRHKGRVDETSNFSATDNTSFNTSSIIATMSSMTQERIAAGNTYEDNQPRDQYCPESCSNLFYPLSKSHVIFQALVITVTWLFMLFTSLRLLWLRRNSKNVFVRCSALWRFILYI
uniref:Uncharacterized protein n=1 Tax=Ciona savignyi TaxID=51511 RepID=H2YMT6_CIOSA